MQKDKKNGLRGFTFVELLVVVTIIAVLTGIAVASYGSTNQKARDSRRKSDLEQVRAALELCRAEAGEYPASVVFADGGELTCDDGLVYLDPIPVDPRLGQAGYSYTYTRGYSTGAVTEYRVCANTMEAETSPYCVYNP